MGFTIALSVPSQSEAVNSTLVGGSKALYCAPFMILPKMDPMPPLPPPLEKSTPADHSVDVRGLSCPLPVLYAHKTLRDMASGAVLQVVFTDPTARRDLPSYCQEAGHQVSEAQCCDDHFSLLIKKA
jgi:tRNA 2-thiouridine synthesizing protein A